jgi:hypothetical protein
MAFALHARGQLDIDGRGVDITVISPNGDEFKYIARWSWTLQFEKNQILKTVILYIIIPCYFVSWCYFLIF